MTLGLRTLPKCRWSVNALGIHSGDVHFYLSMMSFINSAMSSLDELLQTSCNTVKPSSFFMMLGSMFKGTYACI